jgi:hypothetical protein
MITVVIATHNRANILHKTLEKMEHLTPPLNGWKLIIINNASHDDTENILKRFSSRLPLTSLYQEKRGKNYALNMAIPYFEGDLVVFTDNDVLPEKKWLLKYEQLAKEKNKYDILGGKVIPHWPEEPPDYIINAIPLGPAFAVHPENILTGEVNPGMIWGPNMAVKKKIFDRGYRFNEKIGPSQGNYMMGSETEFTHRLCKDGCRVWFSNDIIVEHQIRTEQLKKIWLFTRAIKFGKKAFDSQYKKDETAHILSLVWLKWRVKKFIIALANLCKGFIFNDKAHQYKQIWNLGLYYSVLLESVKKILMRTDHTKS